MKTEEVAAAGRLGLDGYVVVHTILCTYCNTLKYTVLTLYMITVMSMDFRAGMRSLDERRATTTADS